MIIKKLQEFCALGEHYGHIRVKIHPKNINERKIAYFVRILWLENEKYETIAGASKSYDV